LPYLHHGIAKRCFTIFLKYGAGKVKQLTLITGRIDICPHWGIWPIERPQYIRSGGSVTNEVIVFPTDRAKYTNPNGYFA
jgi:hypothetical protein